MDAMDRDPALDRAMLEIARAASDRWNARTRVRDNRASAIHDGRYLDADSPDRIAARINRLTAGARRAGMAAADAPAAVAAPAVVRAVVLAVVLAEAGDEPAASLAPAPVTAGDLTARPPAEQKMLVEEALIGVRNYLSADFLDKGAAAARTVGRIVVLSGGGPRALGTGFLVAPGVLLTNHHVLPDIDRARGCAVQMDFVADTRQALVPQLYLFERDRLYFTDTALDYALVAVAASSDRRKPIAEYGWNPLDGGGGKITVLPDDYLNIVQHPLGRPKEVVIRDNRALDLRTGSGETAAAAMTPFIHYQADTDHGSSGAPVFNDQWEVVALHHMGIPETNAAGQFLDTGGNIWDQATEPVEKIHWLANEGIRVSSLVVAFGAIRAEGEARGLLAQLIAGAVPGSASASAAATTSTVSAVDPPMEERMPERPRSLPAGDPAPAAANALTFDIPLRITVSLGGHPAALPVAAVLDATLERTRAAAAEPVDPASHFDGRDGYLPDFLGVPVPLPPVKPQPVFGRPLPLIAPPPGTNPYELKYARFSVVMNAERRLAYLSAVNVDFAAISAPRTSHDRWARDGRIPIEAQVDNSYYYQNDYDKGHLTRRADGAWGTTAAEAAAANADTFHYTNAAPQHKDFNQGNDFTHLHLKLWGDLEDFIARQGQAQHTRLTIFNGPVFAGNDKPLKDILVPRAFFKIVVWHDAGEAGPGAVGFVLEQTDLIARLPEEAIEPGEFRLRQRRIVDIQATVDLDFGALAAADRFAATPADPLHESLGGVRERLIERLEDIIL